MKPDVYVSDDGGYTWIKALDGPHHYAILDSGGLLVAVEHNPTQPINKIKWVTARVDGGVWVGLISINRYLHMSEEYLNENTT